MGIVSGTHEILRKRFASQWGQRTQVAWPNQDFTPPDNAHWVRLTIGGGEADWGSFGSPGSNLERYRSMLMIQVFGEAGTGEAGTLSYCDNILDAFRDWRSTRDDFDTYRVRVYCIKPGYVQNLGIDDAKKYHAATVYIPFYADYIPTSS